MKMKISRQFMIFVGVLTLGAMMLVACQPALVPVTGEMPVMDPQMDVTEMVVEEMQVRLEVATDPVFGDILVDGNGMTLYMFTMDEPNMSNCADDCLAAWPPLIDDGNLTVGDGVNASLVGSAAMLDGSMIVTYNGMPLYYWVGDVQPGDTNGQDVNKVWYVVSPAGDPIGVMMPDSTASAVIIEVVDHAEFGKILVDGNGMTLYLFTQDDANKSNCTGMCLESWPPLVDDGNVSVGDGLDTSLLGNARLPDGSMIVTYNKIPLYYWVGDTVAGDTNGQGVNDVWYVVPLMMDDNKDTEEYKY